MFSKNHIPTDTNYMATWQMKKQPSANSTLQHQQALICIFLTSIQQTSSSSPSVKHSHPCPFWSNKNSRQGRKSLLCRWCQKHQELFLLVGRCCMRRGCGLQVHQSQLEWLALEPVLELCIWQNLAPYCLQKKRKHTFCNHFYSKTDASLLCITDKNAP